MDGLSKQCSWCIASLTQIDHGWTITTHIIIFSLPIPMTPH